MKIAILEYIVGGGLVHQPLDAIPESLAKEGMAMLGAVLMDLSRSKLRTSFCIDGRFQSAFREQNVARWKRHGFQVRNAMLGNLDPDRVVAATTPVHESWLETAKQADATLVIAPESDGILLSMVQWLRDHGVFVLASDGKFLRATSDKLLTAEAFTTHGVLHPPTIGLDTLLDGAGGQAGSGFDALNSAWVLKRRDGAGCEGMRWANSLDQLLVTPPERPARDWIVQPWIDGHPASVTVFCGPTEHIMLPPCSQRINRSHSVSYSGGTTPYWPVSEKRLSGFVETVLAALPGTPLGWIGIDWIYRHESDECVAIEVNPRITTSVVGLCHLFETSLIESCIQIAIGKPHRLVRSPNLVEWDVEGELHCDEAK